MHRISLALVLLLTAGAAAQDYIWVEGESAARHNMRIHSWYGSVNLNELSGGRSLSHFAAGEPPVAQYDINIPENTTYHFWIRANSVAGPLMSYRLDDGPFKQIDLTGAMQNVNIAIDGKPDMRFISWINVGKLALTKGRHTIAFKFHSPNNNHGAIDCFILSQSHFMPRGALKPGERSGKANPGCFAWEPDIDPFTDEALLDLRYLNEDVAGQAGRLAARGNDFVLGNGQPVKFWAVNAGGAVHNLDHQSQIYLAKHLAKRGVNMVRIHGGIYNSRTGAIDMEKLDDVHHFVAAMKQEGIYTKLSFYFPAWFRLDKWHADGNKWPFMLLFFDQDMQKLYFSWAKALLATPNPYTKIPLGKDPAVAIVEIQNEDSHFFWTFGPKNMPPERWESFKGVYGQWLKKRYGSLSKAFAAWGSVTVEGDDLAAGKVQLLPAWNMTRDGLNAAKINRRRVTDQVRFLTENMRGFYQKAIDRFRTEGGYTGLVSCGNWRTADPSLLEPLEQYCYTVGDVIDHHGYFDHGHEGEASSYSVRPGHTYTNHTALGLDKPNPLPYVEVEGYPSITSEIGWPMPNIFRAEWPFLTAVYGSLTGLDGIFHFSIGGAPWDQSIAKFQVSTPAVLGSFFANALLYRNGYVAEGPSVVLEHSPPEDLLALKGSNVFAAGALDKLRAAQVPEPTRGPIGKPIDPAVFYTGRVTRSFEGTSADSRQMPTDNLIDHQGKKITSATGQLTLNYHRKFATVDAPKAQGSAGSNSMLKAADVDIDQHSSYATVLVVPLDDKPLATSKKILIQAMTYDRPYGWKASKYDAAGTIESLGSAPWSIHHLSAVVTLKSDAPTMPRVVACDENGYPTDKQVKVTGTPDAVRIVVRHVYTVVLR